jgi:hypothetical protein
MAGGWTRDGAVQDQIDDTVKDAIELARAKIVASRSPSAGATHCLECAPASPARRSVIRSR